MKLYDILLSMKTIYLIKIKSSGDVIYVGQTRNFKARAKVHKTRTENNYDLPIYNTIRDIGWSNITIVEYESDLDDVYADDLERYLIDMYKPSANMQSGGATGYTVKQESSDKRIETKIKRGYMMSEKDKKDIDDEFAALDDEFAALDDEYETEMKRVTKESEDLAQQIRDKKLEIKKETARRNKMIRQDIRNKKLQDKLDKIEKQKQILADLDSPDAYGKVLDPDAPLHGSSNLTANDVRAIREDDRSNGDIAEDYGITSGAVGHIKNGRRWAHIE